MPTTILHKESLIPGRTSKLVLDAPQIAATANGALLSCCASTSRGSASL